MDNKIDVLKDNVVKLTTAVERIERFDGSVPQIELDLFLDLLRRTYELAVEIPSKSATSPLTDSTDHPSEVVDPHKEEQSSDLVRSTLATGIPVAVAAVSAIDDEKETAVKESLYAEEEETVTPAGQPSIEQLEGAVNDVLFENPQQENRIILSTDSASPSSETQTEMVSKFEKIAEPQVADLTPELGNPEGKADVESPMTQPQPVAPQPEPKPEPVIPQLATEPVAPQPAPKPEPITTQPAPEPEPIASQPTPKPEPVASQPAPKLEPVASQPAPKPEPIIPQPTPKPEPVIPQPTPKPEPVIPQPIPEPVVPQPTHQQRASSRQTTAQTPSLFDLLNQSKAVNPDSEMHSVRTLADSFTKGPVNVEESLEYKTQKHKVEDLRTIININDKFSFMSELFHNNMKAYNDFILKLNAIHDRETAMSTVSDTAAAYRWEMDSLAVKTFYAILDRKF